MSTFIVPNRFYKYEMLDLLSYPDKVVYFPISVEDFDSMVVAYRELYTIKYCGAYQEFINNDTGVAEFRRWYRVLYK